MKVFVEERMESLFGRLEKVVLTNGFMCPELSLDSRDSLVNIGSGFFACGLYLIMMGSRTEDDSIARSANFHLQKAIFVKNSNECKDCGHLHCPGGDLCTETNKIDDKGWV